MKWIGLDLALRFSVVIMVLELADASRVGLTGRWRKGGRSEGRQGVRGRLTMNITDCLSKILRYVICRIKAVLTLFLPKQQRRFYLSWRAIS